MNYFLNYAPVSKVFFKTKPADSLVPSAGLFKVISLELLYKNFLDKTLAIAKLSNLDGY